ncbi:MAG: type II secretion system protein GspE [Actinobacteria bacterium]|nr:MAG: type II secretion system protein GspE [Actinomycetota bacterium]
MTTVKRKSKQLGQILIELGFITPEQLETALQEHRKTPKSLGRVLIDLGMIKEADLVRALAEQVGLEFVDLNEFPIDATATVLLPEALSRRYRAIPIGERDGRLLVAMSDPANVYALDDIRTITGREVQPVVATANDVEQAIQKFSGMDSQVEAMASIAAEAVDETTAELEEALEDAPIVKLVNAIMTQAVGDRASDVHLEPAELNVRIRFRVDGVLHEPMPPAPKNIQGGLISRLKVMADLNIAERRVPQDGRISMKVGGRALDLRVATLPTVHGEKVVIRVLDKSNALLRLEDLGFLENAYDRFSDSFRKPYGAILVTGPTGSGKSTTMYSTLNILNEESKNIITVEDPVEYRLAGVNQMQVNPKAGLTFASALRSILRADPDIVLIGEIRDKETATIAIEAALTGHLVLSSLHTNDAPSAISRLVEMDVETFLVASAIDAVVAQRLARKLCERCNVQYKPMQMSEEIERLTVERASADVIRTVAVQQGMMTLRDDGLEKARMGITTLDEVARVVK